MSEQNQRLEGVGALKRRKVGVWGVVFMIYCLVAAGAFGIEEMIPLSGPGLTLLMLVLFPIFWALPISEMVAELGAVLPSEGGAYVWTRDALGEMWGWQVGFWGTISTWLQQAMYVVLVVGYVEKFWDMSPMMATVLKVAMIVIFSGVNLMGIKEVSSLSTIFSLLVIVGFAAVTIVGFANWNTNPIEPFYNAEEGVVGSLGGSICIAIWMYSGYECMSNVAGELENPQSIPKGLIIAMPIIALSYLLPTIAGLASVGNWESWNTEGAGAVGYMDILIQFVGPAAGMGFLIIAILSNCSIFNAYIASGSRGFFVMADDHLFPRFLCRVSKNRGVPALSIIIMALFTILLCRFDFVTLAMATTPPMLYLYMALAVSVRKLRKVYPVEERKKLGLYYIPFGKVGLNAMTICPFIIAAIALYVNGTDYFIAGFLMLAISLIGYVICKWVYGGMTKEDPINHPLNPKTKLAQGDTVYIGAYIALAGFVAMLGSVLLKLYEGSWGVEYYLDEYGSGFFSDFWGMISWCRWGGLVLLVVGLVIFFVGRKKDPTIPLKEMPIPTEGLGTSLKKEFRDQL